MSPFYPEEESVNDEGVSLLPAEARTRPADRSPQHTPAQPVSDWEACAHAFTSPSANGALPLGLPSLFTPDAVPQHACALPTSEHLTMRQGSDAYRFSAPISSVVDRQVKDPVMGVEREFTE